MAARRILYFTAEEHYLYRGARRRARARGAVRRRRCRRWPSSASICAGTRGALFALLADLAGEDFHEDQIPFLRGADREAVVQRRLAQRYRDTRLAAALSLGQVHTGRAAQRAPAARLVHQHAAVRALAGRARGSRRAPRRRVLGAAARAGARRAARRARPRLLVVTANRAGLRQCFVENGRLRFARLERTVDTGAAGARRVRALRNAAPGPVPRHAARAAARRRAGAGAGGRAARRARAPSSRRSASDARLAFRTVDGAEAARAARLRALPEGAAAEALYLHLAARKPPREQFASREDRRRYFSVAAAARHRWPRAWPCFAACALFGGARWLEALGAARAAPRIRRARRARAAQQYERITADLPGDPDHHRKPARRRWWSSAASPSAPPRPSGVRARLARAGPVPAVRARRGSTGASASPTGAIAARRDPVEHPRRQADRAGRERRCASRSPAACNATQRNDYRGITAQVQRFAGALGGTATSSCAPQLPFDITSEGTLTGDIGAAPKSSEAPRFTVVLARRLP